MTPIEQVISRKNALADLASRNIITLEQLAALPLEQLQSVRFFWDNSARVNVTSWPMETMRATVGCSVRI